MLFLRDRNLNQSLNDLDDIKLVGLCLAQDRKAFEVLVRRYQKLVYNVVYHMVQSHETAADLTQETFLKAYRSLGGFRSEHRFKPWLMKIATNSALNSIRDAKGSAADSLDFILEESPQAEPESDENLENLVEQRFTQAMLLESLLLLPVIQRQVFLLRYQHDFSYAEIAAVLDQPETTIKSMLFRIKEKLRKIMVKKEMV